MSYTLGYMKAKELSNKWNNPLPTWDDTKSILQTIRKKIFNIPLYFIARCGTLGNRKIEHLIKTELNKVLSECCKYDNIKISRNGLKMMLDRKMFDFVDNKLIKSYKVINNDLVDENKCIWVNERGFYGCVEITLLNKDEVAKIDTNIVRNISMC